MNDDQELNVCRQYLELQAGMPHLPSRLMLLMSRPWRAQALPAGFSRGEPRQCFKNSSWLAIEHRSLTYVEGYACPDGLIPIQHGWCVDEAGNVIDVTLGSPETTHYFGIPVSTRFLQNFLDTATYYGIFGEMVEPRRYIEVLDDLQAGRWQIPADVDSEIRALLTPYTAG
ncbi:TPA: hypothetical protein QDB04_000162 [Burkholderia vietnamiensis]|nr:hypothetical protein [Burkholderia vietnamiensis]